jgi:ABC-type amino acid transport system permease subunit
MHYLGILVIVGIVISASRALKAEERRRKAEGQPHTFRDDALLLLSGLVIVAVMAAGFCISASASPICVEASRFSHPRGPRRNSDICI